MRPNPYSEGSLKAIAEIFLLPIIKVKPAFINLQDWLEDCFGTKTRTIKRYRALRDFTLPGRFYIKASQAIEGLGKREITKGMEVWIRVDKDMPNRIDVELNRNNTGNQVFCLTKFQYKRILFNLQEKSFKERKKEKWSWLTKH